MIKGPAEVLRPFIGLVRSVPDTDVTLDNLYSGHAVFIRVEILERYIGAL